MKPGRFEIAVLTIFLVVGIYQLFIPPLIGIADNGDFERLRFPNGISRIPSDATDQRFNYFFSKYAIVPEPRVGIYYFHSSSHWFVEAARWLNVHLISAVVFDVRVLAAVYMSFFLLGIYLILKSSRQLEFKRRCLLAAALLCMFTDTAYTAYFNSFYSEPTALVALLIIAGSSLLVLMRRGTGLSAMAGYFIASAFLITAKPMYIPLMAIFVPFGIYLSRYVSFKHRYVLSGALSCVLIVLAVGYQAIAPGWLRLKASYIAVFSILLQDSQNRDADLLELNLKPEWKIFIGSTPYDAGGPVETDPQFRADFLKRIRTLTIPKYLVSHPGELYQVASKIAPQLVRTLPDYAGYFEQSSGRPPRAKPRAPWSNIRAWLFPSPLWLVSTYFISGVITLGMIFRKSIRDSMRGLLMLYSLLVAFSAVIFLVPIFTMASFDTRYASTFVMAFDLSLIIAGAMLLEFLRPQLSNGRVHRMNRGAIAVLKVLLLTLVITRTAQAAQSSPESPEVRGRMAIDRGNYTEAISIFSEALAQRPTADALLNLGNAYRRNRDWENAKKTLSEGENQFPQDSRIPEELAHVYLEDGDVDNARNALLRALRIDPVNVEAANQIADIEFSEGEVQTALRFWNRSGRPVVNRVLHNSNITFGNWTVARAQTFQSGKMMTYSQWRTTELRLLETNIYSNVAVNIEPAPVSGRYNPIILTSSRSNEFTNVAFGLLKGAPLETSYLDWWNIANSGITLNSRYRWDYNRKRGELQLHAPLPLPGVVFLNASALWRSERWDLTRVLRTDAGSNDRFQFNSTGFRLELKYIPQFRFEFGGGFEYTNRAANGGLATLLIDSRNSGKVIAETSIRLSDSSQYRNRIHVEGFVARKAILGDFNYSAATVEMNNQFQLSKRTRTVFDWTLKAGMSGGQLPVEDYFTLGVDTHSANLLRAHPAARRGQYGNSPMGTSFALANMRIERRVAVLPFFNTLNIPYLLVKAEAFMDSGKTFDRARIFKEGKLYVDTGAGLKFETPTHSLHLIYGKSLREGWNVFTAYIEKHW